MSGKAWLAFLALCLMSVAQSSPAMAAASDSLVAMGKRVLDDLGGDSGTFITFFYVGCYVMGVVIVATGIYGLTQKHKNAIVMIIVGAIIASIPSFANVMTKTIFDEASSASILSSAGTEGEGKLETAAKVFISFSVFMIQVVGFFALYRGLKTIVDVAGAGQYQPTQMRTAYIFIIAGVICINITYMLALLARTMGSEGIKYYNIMFGHIGTIS